MHELDSRRRLNSTSPPVSDSSSAGHGVVDLVIPATYPYVRLARLTASALGAELGADVERVEELRLLTDEACALLLECALPEDASDDRLHLTFRGEGASLQVVVERPGATIVDQPSSVSAAVLDAISERWRFSGASVEVLVALALPGTSLGAER